MADADAPARSPAGAALDCEADVVVASVPTGWAVVTPSVPSAVADPGAALLPWMSETLQALGEEELIAECGPPIPPRRR